MEGERQREQDELYRGDHAGGSRQEVPTGMGGAADEVSFRALSWTSTGLLMTWSCDVDHFLVILFFYLHRIQGSATSVIKLAATTSLPPVKQCAMAGSRRNAQDTGAMYFDTQSTLRCSEASFSLRFPLLYKSSFKAATDNPEIQQTDIISRTLLLSFLPL